jgi:ABC-type antimicrobial peptide transport system permease subunit
VQFAKDHRVTGIVCRRPGSLWSSGGGKRSCAVRMALGAKSGQILSLILGESSRLAIAGVVAGAGLGYGAGRAMQSLLAGLDPADAATFATAMALAVMMTLAGSLMPTVRAVRVDPAVALRAE